MYGVEWSPRELNSLLLCYAMVTDRYGNELTLDYRNRDPYITWLTVSGLKTHISPYVLTDLSYSTGQQAELDAESGRLGPGQAY